MKYLFLLVMLFSINAFAFIENFKNAMGKINPECYKQLPPEVVSKAIGKNVTIVPVGFKSAGGHCNYAIDKDFVLYVTYNYSAMWSMYTSSKEYQPSKTLQGIGDAAFSSNGIVVAKKNDIMIIVATILDMKTKTWLLKNEALEAVGKAALESK